MVFKVTDMHVNGIFGNIQLLRHLDNRVLQIENPPLVKLEHYFLILIGGGNGGVTVNGFAGFRQGG